MSDNKQQKNISKQYLELIKTYLNDRLFRVKQQNKYSKLIEVNAGVPLGCVLGPVLYLLNTSDILKLQQTAIGTCS